jgi:hypothetical protein
MSHLAHLAIQIMNYDAENKKLISPQMFRIKSI